MSDDEYFDNDDIFTSAELDAIPFLNQPPLAPLPAPSPSAAPVIAPLPPASQPPGTSRSNPINLSEGSSNTASTSLQRSNTVPDIRPQSVASTSTHVGTPLQASASRASGGRFSAIMNALRSTQSGPSASKYFQVKDQTICRFDRRRRSTTRTAERDIWPADRTSSVSYA